MADLGSGLTLVTGLLCTGSGPGPGLLMLMAGLGGADDDGGGGGGCFLVASLQIMAISR